MYLVVCYDVVGDSQRALLHKRLAGFLRPVQKSVFEGFMPDHLYPRLTSAIGDAIDPATDTVRIYRLCGACQRFVVLIGTSVSVPDGPEDLIV